MKNLLKLALVANVALLSITPAFAGQTVKEWMNDYYSTFDENTNCRYAIGGQANLKYCVTLEKAKQVDTKNGKRLYLLMTGDAIEESAPHASGGLVGMFVFAPEGNNKWKVVSAKPKIIMGAWGKAPTDWTFHKFAPNKWGFLVTTSYGMGGQFTDNFNILTPNKQSIQHNVITESDSYNNCEFSTIACYDLSAKLKINSKKVVNGYYPLILTVNGTDDKGKKYKNRKYQAIYKKGKGYMAPKNYPIS